MQAGATDLLLAKRSLGFVGAARVVDSVTLSFNTCLQAPSTLVQQGIILCFMLVTNLLFAFTFVEANAQRILSVEFCRNAKDVGVALRRRTVALTASGLLPVVANLGPRATNLLEPCFSEETLNA